MKLFRIFGIDVKLHFSWWFIFLLLTWSLSASFFPEFYPGQTVVRYWTMGIIAALLLFVSVLLHELSHSLVAQAKKIPVESITLFFFGGVAGIGTEKMPWKDEFQMAVAGPLFSFALSGLFYLGFTLVSSVFWNAIMFYLYQLNLILAIFNLMPGYPLDGGRAFRALLYAYYKDLRKATAIAARGGKIVATILIVLGLLGLFTGTGGGIWFIFLGAFLYFVAGVSYQQVAVQEVLQKVPVKKVMIQLPEVKSSFLFTSLMQKYRYSPHTLFSVPGKGVLDITAIRNKKKTVGELVIPLTKIKSVPVTGSAFTALKKLSPRVNVVRVVSKGKLVGFVTKKDLAQCLLWG
jgi:Zn-dependent protease